MLDVTLVLEKLESMNLLRLGKIIGNYYQIYCPSHAGGQENRPSCGVLLTEEVRNGQIYSQGWCHCFTCSYVNTLPGMIEDILKSKSIAKTGMDWLIENIPGFEALESFDFLIPKDLSDTLMNMWKHNANAARVLQSVIAPRISYVPEAELAKYRFTVPYMYERKLTDSTIACFDIGYDPEWRPDGKRLTPCITFPVRDAEGRCLFVYRRAIAIKMFGMPELTDKPLYGVYELKAGTKSAILTESIINCCTAHAWGYQALALMGTGNPKQIQQIKQLGLRELVICMDGDSAGRRAAKRIKKSLSSCMLISIIEMEDGKDLNDCDCEEFRELYNNRI